MNILSWILLGLLASVIINLFEAHPHGQSFINSSILGILGAILGGFLANLLLNQPIFDFSLGSIIIAMISALALLFITKSVIRGELN
jgi:uncharacterized membrane protein YeaQ/YmgE (transglycosylase-associated protein family)